MRIKGRNITSKDQRKKQIVAAFKEKIPACTKVTMLKEKSLNSTFVAHIMGSLRGTRQFVSLGVWELEVANHGGTIMVPIVANKVCELEEASF